jgi:hypothetical protein
MRKGWLVAAVLGGCAGVSQAADVQIFGIHNPSLGRWAVYARLPNTTSVVSGQVSGLSSIAVDISNNNVVGTGSATVTSATNFLPSGTSNYSDATIFNPPTVGYGFWLVRSDGTVDATGIKGISGAQYAINPAASPPYKNLVLPGVGVSGGAITGTPGVGDFNTSTAWGFPVEIANGTYTPSATTGAGSQVGLKVAYSGDTGVNLVRGSTAAGWSVEGAVGTTVIDARNFTLGQNNNSDGSTIKAGPGDADLDGTVGFGDLVRLAQSYNTPRGKTWFDGDFNFDHGVDFGDLVILAQKYNQPVPASAGFGESFDQDLAAAFASVPEPGTLGLVGVSLAGFLRRRRK